MVLESFTEKRKSPGTLSRHRSQVEARCGRWKLLLISAAEKRVE
jgi:hypothetical protein